MVQSKATTVAAYLRELPPERRGPMEQMRRHVNAHLPKGYVEGMQYGMIGWSIPLSVFKDTYNGQPLAVAGLASQKNSMTLYLMCTYMDAASERAFHDAYARSGKKLDMGKSCLHFKRIEDVAMDVVGDALARATPAAFIALHEQAHAGRRKAAPKQQRAAPKKRPAAKKSAPKR